jgi:hypothetical protein
VVVVFVLRPDCLPAKMRAKVRGNVWRQEPPSPSESGGQRLAGAMHSHYFAGQRLRPRPARCALVARSSRHRDCACLPVAAAGQLALRRQERTSKPVWSEQEGEGWPERCPSDGHQARERAESVCAGRPDCLKERTASTSRSVSESGSERERAGRDPHGREQIQVRLSLSSPASSRQL